MAHLTQRNFASLNIAVLTISDTRSFDSDTSGQTLCDRVQAAGHALIDRALVLDAEFGSGAIHAFLISYELARQGAEGSPEKRSREHFQKAIAMSQGQLAGPYVTFAESVCVQQQNVAEFTTLLEEALAVDVNARREWRLENLVMQERAGWLLAKTDELFLLTE